MNISDPHTNITFLSTESVIFGESAASSLASFTSCLVAGECVKSVRYIKHQK